MSFVCEKVGSEETAKYAMAGINDFIRIRNSQPNDLISKKLSPPGYHFMHANLQNCAEKVKEFKVREDDVWVVSFPKCGTTWTQEMVWQICNNLDFEKGNTIPLHHRYTYFE